MFGRLYL
ncbi:hypothetical protein D030_1632A, partial [Vibrio parahaemolyticus AQ3810]